MEKVLSAQNQGLEYAASLGIGPAASASPADAGGQSDALPGATPKPAKRGTMGLVFVTLLILAGASAAGLRALGTDRDYWQYVYYFELVRSGGCEAGDSVRFEPGFNALVCGMLALDGNGVFVTDAALFFTFALIALSLKFSLLRNVGPSYFIAICLYIIRFFPLHESTQVRASISLGFVYWAAFLWFESRKKQAIAMTALAVVFHYSALLIALLALLVQFATTRARFVLVLLGLVVLLGLKAGDIVTLATPYFATLQMGSVVGFGSAAPNLLSLGVVLDVLTIAAWGSLWSTLTWSQQRCLLLYAFGLVVLWTSVDFPIIAWRVAEASAPALCILIAAARSRPAVILGLSTLAAHGIAYGYYFATRSFFH